MQHDPFEEIRKHPPVPDKIIRQLLAEHDRHRAAAETWRKRYEGLREAAQADAATLRMARELAETGKGIWKGRNSDGYMNRPDGPWFAGLSRLTKATDFASAVAEAHAIAFPKEPIP